MRRGLEDEKWQEVKEKVYKRDKTCRFLAIMTWAESKRIMKKAPAKLLNTLDPAHVFPVSLFPHLVYDVENVVLLCRYVHECLDSGKNPITGDSLTKEEHENLWMRIIGEARYTKLRQKAYSQLPTAYRGGGLC